MSRFTEWSQMAATSPARWTPPKPRTRIIVRLMPTIVGQHVVRIVPGEPAAVVAINRTTIHFTDPLDANGHPTPACRDFIVEVIRDAARRDRYLRWIRWPDGTTTASTSSDCGSVTSASSASSLPVPEPALVIQGKVVDRSDVFELPTRH